MLFHFTALLSGLIFGFGMMLSGMVDPARVLGFLDLAGAWDPRLAFVMAGALLVFVPVYFFHIRYRPAPVCGEAFHINTKTKPDVQLIAGSVVFGVGWGMAGICPGPAITAVSSLHGGLLTFILAMLGGIGLVQLISRLKS